MTKPGGMRAEALPDEVAVFPLPGAILLPHGHLPLNVFEPCYVQMVEDSLASGRMIAMIQPREAFADPVPDDAALYEVGCIGRIVSFAETDGGGFLITLQGQSRFRAAAELSPRNGYRRVRPDYGAFARDRLDVEALAPARERLIAAANDFFAARADGLDWSVLAKAPDERLVTTLAMICPFLPSEKQALLESPNTPERAELLTALLAMGAREGGPHGESVDGTRH